MIFHDEFNTKFLQVIVICTFQLVRHYPSGEEFKPSCSARRRYTVWKQNTFRRTYSEPRFALR